MGKVMCLDKTEVISNQGNKNRQATERKQNQMKTKPKQTTHSSDVDEINWNLKCL